MNLEDIIKDILSIDNINDLKDIYAAYIKRGNELMDKFLAGFKGGDIVEWYHSGIRYEGEIIRVNSKTITVQDSKKDKQYRILSQSLKLIKAREKR